MSIKYYKLFDLLNRRNMKKSDLLEIISSKTIAKLSKGANVNTDIIDKICLHLKCQPSDIMEVVEEMDVQITNEWKDANGKQHRTIEESKNIHYAKETIKEIMLDDNNNEYDINQTIWVERDKETEKIIDEYRIEK